MADAQKTIDLIFNGVDKTGAATMAALDNAKKFTGSLQNVTAPIADFTMGAVKLEAGLLAAGLAMTVFAVKTAGDFEQSFSLISTLFDATDEDLAKFKTDVQAYAAESGKSMQDVMASLGAAIGSGVKYTEALGLMSVAEKLSIATKSDMKGATETLVSVMNAYGIETKDAGVTADLLFQIIKDGKIEMVDLASGFSKITAIAAPAGVSMKDVGAAVAALTATGIPASTAMDSVRGAISNILKPSEQAKDLAAALGIEFDGNALKAKGLSGVLADVAVKTGGSADKMSLLFGDVNALAAALVLTGTSAEVFTQIIKSMGNSTGSVSAAYDKLSGSIDVLTTRAGNAFNDLLVTIGQPLLDKFGGITTAITGIFAALSASVKNGDMKELTGYIESVFGDIENSLKTVAKNLPAALRDADFSDFKDGIKAVVDAVKSLFGGLDITSVNGLKDAIELVGVAFLGLSKYTAGVIEVFKPLFDAMVSVGSGAKEVDLSFLELAGNLGGIATQLNVVLPLFTGLLGILAAKQGVGLLSELKGLPALLTAATTAAGAGGLSGALGSAGLLGAAGAAGVAVGTGIGYGIDLLLSKIAGSETTLGGFIYDLLNGAKEAEQFGLNTGNAAAGVEALGKGAAGAAAGVDKVGKAADGTVNPFEKANQAMLDNFAAAEKSATGADKLGKSTDSLNTYAMKTVPIIDAATGKITGYEQQLVKSADGTIKLGNASDKTGKDLNKIAAETDKAKEATKRWNEEVAKMAFEEKVALIESQTKIMTAAIEADGKKVVAAFDSIGDSITASGKVLEGLQGQMSGFDNLSNSTKWKIEDQIEIANKRMDDALKVQSDLAYAQIANMKAQTAAMLKGEGLIKIDGAGLQPHLEAFMWEILKAIQVKVSKDGLKMLLGT